MNVTTPNAARPVDAALLPALRERSVYARTRAVCDRVAAAAVQGADCAELTRVFAQAFRRTVVLLNADLRFQARADGGPAVGDRGLHPGEAEVAGLLRRAGTLRRTVCTPALPGAAAGARLATPVLAGDTVLGYLLVTGGPAATVDDADLIVADHVAALFAVTLVRAGVGCEPRGRHREAVLDSLLSGHFLDGADARRKACLLGLAESQPYRIAVTRPGEPEPPLRPGESEQGLLAGLRDGAGAPAVIRGTELVMLLPADQDPPPIGPGTGLTCGISEAMRTPEQAPRALLQAQQAIDLGVRIGRAGQVVHYEELGIYRLLLQVSDLTELVRYAEDVLGPVIDYDERRKSDLLGTLSVYLNQHESPKQAARVLRVHVNTVLYRIQRIETLTALDLADPDHRLNAHVATKIIESQRSILRSTQP